MSRFCFCGGKPAGSGASAGSDQCKLRTGDVKPSGSTADSVVGCALLPELPERRWPRGANEVARRLAMLGLVGPRSSGCARKKAENSASEMAFELSASSCWKIASKRSRLPSSCLMLEGRPSS